MTKENRADDSTSLKELIITNAIQADTLARLLIEKGIFTKDEYLDKMREVQTEYFNEAT
jgi:hypothetical protein